MGVDYIKYIVANKLCTRCGICAGVCPKKVFEMGRDFLPEVVSDECIDCGLCSDSCPGRDVDFKELAKIAGSDQNEYHEYIGHFIDYVAGYSTDPEIRRRSSSGGIVTALLKYALAEKIVHRAVVAEADPDRPCCFKPVIVTDPAELSQATGSKYSFVNTCKILKDVINREGKTAIVALSCQVHALRKYMAKVPCAQDKIIIIGLACSSAMPLDATEFILRSNHVKPTDVEEVRYRSGIWPGQWVANFKDGREIDLTRPKNHEYVFKILNRLFPVPRCLLCSDGYNEFSDISVSDPWFAIRAGVDRYIDDRGWSLAIVRTEKGRNIIEGALGKNYIYIESIRKRIDPDQVTPMLIEKKRYVPLRIKRLEKKGRPVPDYNLATPKTTLSIRWREWKNRMQYFILAHKLSRMIVAVLLKHKF